MKRALVVDDSAEICEFLTDLLEYYDFEVVHALTGERAIELSRDLELSISFIDIYLPGINGIEVMRELKKQHPDVLCILMSAYPEEDTIKEGFHLGADKFLQKPFAVEEVKKVLEKID